MSAIKPEYYNTEDTYEPLKIIQAHNLNFCLGNVIKYTLRAGKKNALTEIEDLQKAVEYLNRHIEDLKRKQPKIIVNFSCDSSQWDNIKNNCEKKISNGLSYDQDQYIKYTEQCYLEFKFFLDDLKTETYL